eukprot:scaffold23137_cov66-Phaeocystis_antarctica.AAC.3
MITERHRRRARQGVPCKCKASAGKWKMRRHRTAIAVPRLSNSVAGCIACLAYRPSTINGVWSMGRGRCHQGVPAFLGLGRVMTK